VAIALVFLHFKLVENKSNQRVALHVTQKRITAKTSGRQSIDADIKSRLALAATVGYLRHTLQIISFFSSSKFFLPCWLEFFNLTLMKPRLKQGHHFHIWNVDPSLYRNNRTRYSRKTEAKTGKLK